MYAYNNVIHWQVCRALVDGGADVLKRNGKNRRAKEQVMGKGGGGALYLQH
jgi:hypothetical protein